MEDPVAAGDRYNISFSDADSMYTSQLTISDLVPADGGQYFCEVITFIQSVQFNVTTVSALLTILRKMLPRINLWQRRVHVHACTFPLLCNSCFLFCFLLPPLFLLSPPTPLSSPPSTIPPRTGVPVVEAVSVSPVLGIKGLSTTLQFSVSADALPPVIPANVEWRFNPISGPVVTLTQSSSVRYAFSADMLSLTITGLVSADEGTYTLIASTIAGSDSAAIHMFVRGTVHLHVIFQL